MTTRKQPATSASVFNFRRQLLTTCVGVALCAAVAVHAQAQTATYEPGLVEKRFQPAAPLPPTVPGEAVARPKAPAGQAAGAEQFVLTGVNVEGSTVYSQDQLRETYADMLGKTISTNDIRQIAAAISAKYRSDGYIISQAMVPDQTVSGGVVQIRVLEGYVDNITIEGEHVERASSHLVENLAGKIRGQRPLTSKTLERYLLLIDDLPGVTAKAVFRPKGGDPAAVDMVVVMTHEKWEASVQLDNRGTKITGPYQWTATGTGNSVFGIYDRTLVRGVVTSPVSELWFGDIQHEEQIGSEGTRLVLYGSHLRSEPGEFLKPLDIHAKSTSLFARVYHPFQRSRTQNLSGRVLFNWRKTETDVFDNIDLTNDTVSVLRGGGSFDKADSFNGVNLIDAEVSQGLAVLGATDDKGINRSRPDADATFTKFNLDLAREQSLPYGFSFLTSASAQYSLDPLLAGEEYTLGGIGYGQAFDPSELSGDHGLAGKLELRYGRAADWKYLSSYQLYTYYDIGSVWIKDAPAGVDEKSSLSALGVGIRANFTPVWSGTAEAAIPLVRDVAQERDDDTRFFFSVTGRF